MSTPPRRSARTKKTAAVVVASTSVTKIEDDVEEKKVKTSKKNASKQPSRKRKTQIEVKGEVAESEKSPEKKIKSVQVKGRAPVDDRCLLKDSHHVYYDDEGLWDCMLNQTNIQNNNNKYYLIQLLEQDGGKSYQVWMRWGRVGYGGQTSLTNCGNDVDRAKNVFCTKFRDKTKNDWHERENFQKYSGKYDLVQMDYSTDDAPESNGTENVNSGHEKAKASKTEERKTPESKLAQALQDLIKMICDVTTMEETVIEMQYDTKKSPLGKITKEQIKAGYEALSRIADLVEKPNQRALLVEACNDFYTRIPHEFGMRAPPLIRSITEVKNKIQLLEALGDIQVAMKILKDKANLDMNPIDRHYIQLECDINPLKRESDDFTLIEKYILTTHGKTHSSYTMEVEEIFECNKGKELERFADKGNRMLLFHGSRMSNWAGILSQGLRIAPPEAPVTGYMFGKGVYFADMSSKSANYCWPTPSKNVGLLLMCEVALGTPNELTSACYRADKLPRGKTSVKGLGRTGPDLKNAVALADGTLVPIGPGVDTNVKDTSLFYNEYIVYDVSQIKMRYLAKIKFNFKSNGWI